ncbi:MAG: c-type cytochrome [Marinobacter sp.]
MSLKKLTMAGLMSAALLAPGFASAGGDPEAGKAKAAVCAACHGKDGIAKIPSYPRLAGQNEAYLVSSLKAYKNKQRSGGQSAVMQGQATGLSEEDIENLAAYYASLPAEGSE